MKFIKTVVLALALLVSTHTFAQGVEEFCHGVADTDVAVKQRFQEDPENFKDFLSRLVASEKNTKIKAALRERLYWIYNNKDLPDPLMWKLSYLKCSARMQ